MKSIMEAMVGGSDITKGQQGALPRCLRVITFGKHFPRDGRASKVNHFLYGH
jgi:beta-glucosidase-like glycosyl hydrolase